MSRNPLIVLYAVVMIAVILGLDFTILRHHIMERLIVNISIVVVFAAFYLLFRRNR